MLRAYLVQLARQPLRLVPADGLLHVRREVLDAQREPVESQPPQQIELLAGGDARVDLDGLLRVRIELEVPRDRLVQPLHLRGLEVGRRAAAPVVLDDAPPRSEPLGQHRDFPVEVVQVPDGDLALLGDDDHAPAVPAALPAERQVRVERQRFVGRGGRVQPPAVGRIVERVVELDGGRIRGVARTGTIVPAGEATRRTRWTAPDRESSQVPITKTVPPATGRGMPEIRCKSGRRDGAAAPRDTGRRKPGTRYDAACTAAAEPPAKPHGMPENPRRVSRPPRLAPRLR